MSSLPANATIAEIEEEILYQQTLIASLDPDGEDYAERLEELQTELSLLEERLALANDSSLDVSDSSISFESASTPLTAPRLAASDSESSSRTGSANPFKRLLPNDFTTYAPAKRPSPSPTWSVNILQERARQRQLQAEAEWKVRQEQRDRDAQYARELSQRNGLDDRPVAGPSSRPAFQSTLGSNGNLLPPVRSLLEQNQGYQTLPSQVKPDPEPVSRQYQPPSRSWSDEVIDLTVEDSTPPTRFQNPNQTFTVPSQHAYQPMPGTFPGPASGLGTGLYIPGTSRPPYQPSGPGFGPSSMQVPATNLGQRYTPWSSSNLQLAASSLTPFQQLQNLIDGANNKSRSFWHGGLEDDDEDDDDDVVYQGARYGIPGSYNPYAGREDLYNRRYEQIEAYNPEKTREEINALLNNIRPDEELPDDLLVQTPEAMNIKLHKYQELGLTWLKKCEEGSNKGGILADDMGLGKTIQMLSLIVSRKATDPRCKTTLIVAPVALLRQWRQEIESRIKRRFGLTVHIHHATAKKSSFRDLAIYDIVLTTFGSLATEARKMEKFQLRKQNDPHAVPRADEKCILIDPDSRWYRVILDEAQCIKNKQTQTARAAYMLNATYRFCMTGTPMMNNVGELYSLVKFLRIKPYDRWEKFRSDIAQPLKGNYESARDAAMQRLQALCKAVMLRRTKKSHYRGKPILQLPERTTDVDHAEFDEDELSLYQSLEQKTQITFNKYLRAGAVGRSYSAILVLLLRLRQACCHPFLITDLSIAAAADMSSDDLLELARQLPEQAVARIKETNGNFECPICMDAVINPAIFLPCGHDTCRECYIKLADTSTGIAQGYENGVKARCPHCRGDIDPKRITDFVSFKREWMPELLTQQEKEQFGICDAEQSKADEAIEDDQAGDATTETESEGDDDESTASEDEGSDLDGFIVKDDESESEMRSKKAGKRKVEENRPIKNRKSKNSKKSKKKLEPIEKEPKRLTLATLKSNARSSSKRQAKLMEKLRDSFQDSAKIRQMIALLDQITANDPTEKILIFSQWTSLLDLCEIAMEPKGWDYRRYDGSMSAKDRGDAVDDFKDGHKDVRIMLVSLKAGNAGLNLNVASQVIILDPFWNPYIEEQAIDRAHRIGQTRPVKVHRILIENTVEDRIIALQENKRKIIETALDEQQASQLSRLGPRELAYLFGISRNIHDPV